MTRQISIKIFGEEYEVRGDEKLESILKEIESMLNTATEAGKKRGYKGEDLKRIAVIETMVDLISQKRKLEKHAQDCIDILQEINFELEKKFELD